MRDFNSIGADEGQNNKAKPDGQREKVHHSERLG